MREGERVGEKVEDPFHGRIISISRLKASTENKTWAGFSPFLDILFNFIFIAAPFFYSLVVQNHLTTFDWKATKKNLPRFGISNSAQNIQLSLS